MTNRIAGNRHRYEKYFVTVALLCTRHRIARLARAQSRHRSAEPEPAGTLGSRLSAIRWPNGIHSRSDHPPHAPFRGGIERHVGPNASIVYCGAGYFVAAFGPFLTREPNASIAHASAGHASCRTAALSPEGDIPEAHAPLKSAERDLPPCPGSRTAGARPPSPSAASPNFAVSLGTDWRYPSPARCRADAPLALHPSHRPRSRSFATSSRASACNRVTSTLAVRFIGIAPASRIT